MTSEASNRQFRNSRNAFLKYAKELSSQLCNDGFDDEDFSDEMEECDKLYNVALTDGQAYRATLGEDENDEAQSHRDKYETDVQSQNGEYNKVKENFTQ